jgi:hypothetical protein
MARQYKFLDKDDLHAFDRNDATSALCIEHEQAVDLTFPLDVSKQIARGMKLVFIDTDPDGERFLRFYEIRNEKTSTLGRTQQIHGEDMGLAELSDKIIAAFTVSKTSWATCVTTILSGTGWTSGDVPSDLPPESYTYQVYKVQTGSSSKLTLRSGPGTSYNALGYYSNGTQVRKVSTSGSWTKVIVGGKTGYMISSSLQYYKTVTVAGLPKVTLAQSYKDAYSLLVAVLKIVGLVPSFRIVYSGGVLSRYVDFKYQGSEIYNGARIEIDRSAYADSIEEDDHGLYTAIYPTGANGITIGSRTWTMDAGNPADKPNGQLYLEDVGATSVYGRNDVRRECHVEFNDIDDPADLIVAAWAHLQTVNKPAVSIRISTFDLSAIGYSGKRLSYTERVNVVLKPIDRQESLNVVELTRDLENEEKTILTIGAFGMDVVADVVDSTVAAEDIANAISNGIRAGVINYSRTTWTAGTNYTQAVTFAKAFSVAPKAVILQIHTVASTVTAYTVAPTSITPTGFTFNISRNADRSASTDLDIGYIAM